MSPGHGPPLYYEERVTCERKRRYCIKQVKIIETKTEKDEAFVNIQLARENKSRIYIDAVEEKKIHKHFDFVTTKLQKLHKSVMWNMFIGYSALGKRKTINKALEEDDIDNLANREFDINNPKTWSKKVLDDVEHTS